MQPSGNATADSSKNPDFSVLNAVEKLVRMNLFDKAFSIVAGHLCLNRIYLLSADKNRKMSVSMEWTDGKCRSIKNIVGRYKMISDPELIKMLTESGFLHLTCEKRYFDSAVSEIIRQASTKECVLSPVYALNNEFSFLVCSRTEKNSAISLRNELKTVNALAAMTGKALSRLLSAAKAETSAN